MTAFSGPGLPLAAQGAGQRRSSSTASASHAAAAQRQTSSPTAISEQLIHMGDKVMEGRESTTKTMRCIDRADLPWRAGEWFVLRLIAVVIWRLPGLRPLRLAPDRRAGRRSGRRHLRSPLHACDTWPRRRAKKFEAVLPDVLMLVATSLASGFSLLQALDAVAKDAPEPAAKEFSRALAEARIGADVSDALDHMAGAHGQREHALDHHGDPDPARGRWQPRRDPADHRGDAAGARDAATPGARRCRPRAGSRPTSWSALPVGLLLYSYLVNYDYVSLLWTTFLGIVMMRLRPASRMAIGIFWMRKVVKIEV